jgi:hypothetical protein
MSEVKCLADAWRAPHADCPKLHANRKDGATMILQERQRQTTAEGFSSAHDDAHLGGELAQAAAFYAYPDEPDPAALWPKSWSSEWNKKAKHQRVRQLVIAGALCAAVSDRLRRLVNGARPEDRK